MKKNYLEPRIKVNTVSIEAVMVGVSDTPTDVYETKEKLEADENLLDGLFD